MSSEAGAGLGFDEETVVDMVVGNAPGLFAVVRGRGPGAGVEIVAWGLRLTGWLLVVDLADRVVRHFASLAEVEAGYRTTWQAITVPVEASTLFRTLLQDPTRLSQHWRSAALEQAIADNQV
ncbi:hypothetical protein KCV87_14005 [Actinosynnema pretiosum subsp. pretiosum]|uniref:Uncharacterized protein n=1 Tax=Actinosynnema pretiosum subsp. pretiosum TaxID=103721 RepID=A0AA45R6H8_9PSEU|nr:hypothetical protein KCV87_14005 [Actinosynnema pretiosum subsp. pretiosum]